MRQPRNDRATDVMMEAMFELTEHAQDLVAKKSPADHRAQQQRFRAIGRVGADIETLAAAIMIIKRRREPPHS